MVQRMHPFRLRPPKDDSVVVELEWPPDAPSGASNAMTNVPTSELMTYWASQQARVGAHESARFSFSAFILAGSLVALAQVGQGQMLAVGRWGVVLSVILVNLLAAQFTLSELRWIKIHQARASAVLTLVLPPIRQMQVDVNRQWCARKESGDNTARFTSSLALQATHWLVALAALIMGFAVR